MFGYKKKKDLNPESNSITNELNQEEKDKKSKYIFEKALDKYINNNYKQTIAYINSNELNEQTTYYWQIIYIKLCSYQKLIENKLKKHYNSNIIKVEKYLIQFSNILKIFIDNIKSSKNISTEELNSNKYECLITLLLNQCHNYAKYCIYQSLIFDSIGFLALAERLIKNTSDFFISPEIMHIASSIYLFLSSLHIISENFGTAKRYIILSLKLLYKELELGIGKDTFRNILINLSKNNDDEEFLRKIFLNMTICFYHLGVCCENEYDFESAYQAYKQAKWFGKAIPNDEMLEFLLSIYNMEKRELLRNQMFDFFKVEAQKIYDEPKVINQKPNYLFNEENKIKKFEKLKIFLGNLKLTEIDDEEPDLLNKVTGKAYSQRVGNSTKVIHVLNYLMEDKFNEVIDKMKKIEINRMNNQTKEIIQKQIIKMKNDERALLSLKEKKKKENKINNTNEKSQNNITNVFYNKDIELMDINIYENQRKNKKSIRPYSSKIKLISNNYSSKTSNTNINTLTNNYSLEISNRYNTLNNDSLINNVIDVSKSKNLSKNKKKQKKKIEKINYDFYVFNKKFRDKQNFLDQQFNRECKFQKSLLLSKQTINYDNVENFNRRKTYNECEKYYNTTLKNQLKLIQEKHNLKDEKNKNSKKNYSNKKAFRTFLPGITELISTIALKKKSQKSLSPKSKNMKIIDDLTSKIEEINNIKVYLKNSFRRNLTKERGSKNKNI